MHAWLWWGRARRANLCVTQAAFNCGKSSSCRRRRPPPLRKGAAAKVASNRCKHNHGPIYAAPMGQISLLNLFFFHALTSYLDACLNDVNNWLPRASSPSRSLSLGPLLCIPCSFFVPCSVFNIALPRPHTTWPISSLSWSTIITSAVLLHVSYLH